MQKTIMNFDQMNSKYTIDKENIGKEIFSVLEELINFKSYIESTLSEIDCVYQKEL